MKDMLAMHENKIRAVLTHGGRIDKLELVVRRKPSDNAATQKAATEKIKNFVKAAEDMFMWGEPQCAMLLVGNKTYVLSNIEVAEGIDSALFLAYPEGTTD